MNRYVNYRRIAIILCLSLLLPHFLFLTTLQVDAASTGIVTATSIFVRSGPGTTYSKVQVNGNDVYIKNGEKVNIIDEKDGWYNVSVAFNGKTVKGYVKSDFIKADKVTPTITPTKVPTKTPNTTPEVTPTQIPGNSNISADFKIPGKVIATSLNVRKETSVTSSKVASITNGKIVTILNEVINNAGKWYRISYVENKKTITGYVLSDFIQLTLESRIKANVSSTSKIKFKKTASDTGKYVTTKTGTVITLKNNKSVTITKEVNDAKGQKWFYVYAYIGEVKYNGYILANNVKIRPLIKTPTPTVTVAPTKEPTVAPTKVPTKAPTSTPTPTSVPTPMPEINIMTEAVINKDGVDIYQDILGQQLTSVYDVNNNPIKLSNNYSITIYTTVTGTNMYYFVSFIKEGRDYYGYVKADNVRIGAADSPSTEVTPTPTTVPIPIEVLTPAQFEKSLEAQGFPESYKSALRELHAQNPNWIFEAYHTGLDWNTVIEKEAKVGVNLITNNKSAEWKSFETGAYNWKTDKFIPFDGSTWMTVSKEGLAYYMDPRNFLNKTSIFQFELLEYKNTYQNTVGVEGILYNTALYNKSYTYIDDNGKKVNITYGETFVKAAEYTGVSPYHLASRVKQEVVTGTTTLSNSVSGTVSGYENLYNFYNIGAYHSTAPGGAIANGLKYAANGTTDAATNALLLIPWTSPYRAIVGGAYNIGQNYIKRGQNTIYLQKFNVTQKSTYSHQYMANVEAPNAEAKKVYAGYSSMMEAPIVFSIPVYNNMSAQASPVPTTVQNPNNWLKTLEVDNFSLTPTFNMTNAEQVYSIIVENSVDAINIRATSVSSKASIIGTGNVPLDVGLNEVEIDVFAETGDVKTYTIYITRE